MHPMAEPLVSAVLPAHNAQAFIEQSIASVLRQSYRKLEVIVVDDGSTDRTAELVSDYARRDPRVVYLHQPNLGVAAARNRGIAEARGCYIAPIDADDVWFPEKIGRQVTLLQRAPPRVALAYAWSLRINASGERCGAPGPRPQVRGRVYPAFVYKNFCSASAPLIRRECIAAVGGYDPSLRTRGAEGCEDIDLLLRLADRFEFELVPEYLVAYRQWAGSMSCNTVAMERSFRIVMQRVAQSHPELPARISRWAFGQFYLHLVGRAKQLGDHAAVLRYLRRAMFHDPSLACMPHMHRSGLTALARLVTGGGGAPASRSGSARAGAGRAPGIFGRWRERSLQARLEFVCGYRQPPSCDRDTEPAAPISGASGRGVTFSRIRDAGR